MIVDDLATISQLDFSKLLMLSFALDVAHSSAWGITVPVLVNIAKQNVF